MTIASYEVNSIQLPEGEVQFITAAVRQHLTGRVFPINFVVGSDFEVDWDSASRETVAFSTTVLLWGNSVQSIEDHIENFGYSLIDESDGVLVTSDCVTELMEST